MERWIQGWSCVALAVATLTAGAAQASADGGPGFPRTGTLPSGTASVLSRDGSTLVVGDPAQSRLLIYSRPAGGWGAPIGPPAAVTTGPPGTPVVIGDAVDVSDDGGVVITQGYSGAVRVLEIFRRPYTGWASGNLQASGGGPVSGDLTVSGDGGTIATGNGGTGVSVWTSNSWGGYSWNSLGETPSQALDLPYDGSSLAVAGGTTAVHGIRAAAVLPRPSGGWDRWINVWPLPDARPGLFGFGADIAYSGDGRTLVASGVNSDGALLYDGTGAPTLLTRPGGGAVQGDVALSTDGATVTFTVGPWQGDVVTYAFLRPSGGWPDSLHETSAIVGPKTNGSGRSTVLADGETLAISGSTELGLYSRDRTAPATSVAVPPADGRDGWHVRPVTVALAADDGLNGAGTVPLPRRADRHGERPPQLLRRQRRRLRQRRHARLRRLPARRGSAETAGAGAVRGRRAGAGRDHRPVHLQRERRLRPDGARRLRSRPGRVFPGRRHDRPLPGRRPGRQHHGGDVRGDGAR